ncbi:hypothetical protein HK100_003096 [Physocladia obscura]|uniref:RNI-like protein n=1 Tax=Physocladia obscura TaxID=109957 RepID=A0AAD5XJD9_9FUNG|nr:hypothetical protein HK100_003096 [Physocladia obscura]
MGKRFWNKDFQAKNIVPMTAATDTPQAIDGETDTVSIGHAYAGNVTIGYDGVGATGDNSKGGKGATTATEKKVEEVVEEKGLVEEKVVFEEQVVEEKVVPVVEDKEKGEKEGGKEERKEGLEGAKEKGDEGSKEGISRLSLSRLSRLSHSQASRLSRRSSAQPVPLASARRASNGPPVPINALAGVVRSTNPILDEILHAITLLAANDAQLTSLDLKDCPILAPNLVAAIADALPANTHLTSLNLCNTQLSNAAAADLADALKTNKSLLQVNLESNAIGPQGMKLIAESLAVNSTLQELRLSNQKQPTGIDAEQTFANSVQKNETLLKFSLQFRDVASRNLVDRSLMRNQDKARRLRWASSTPANS